MADSFQGGVSHAGAGRADLRARVAIHGANLQALTGDETFRIPLARCSLDREGPRILVRDEGSPLVIWSDDEAFLRALERAQRGTLRDQVHRLEGARRLRRGLTRAGVALAAIVAVAASAVPVTRWAVRGGVPAIANGIGESALERLALPTGLAPTVERELGVIAERLRPALKPAHRSFRLLLAPYTHVHGFSVPPETVIVTSGLVCAASGPDDVMAAVALELAHLETRDVSQRVGDAVDGDMVLALARGDIGKLRARMLDFADPKRSPGYTPEQDTAADERARAMLARVGVVVTGDQDLATPTARVKGRPAEAAQDEPAAAREPAGQSPFVAADWAKVRAEACELIGR